MKNKEIIREGLEHCIANDCGGCPNLATEYCSMPKKFQEEVLALINRQQAEIEELKKVVIDDYASEYDSKIRAEAIKEFAERLKDEASEKVGVDEDFLYYDFDDEFKTFDSVADVIKFLSAIVIKEMVGEQG